MRISQTCVRSTSLERGRHRCPATRRSICGTSSRRMAAGSAMERTWKPYSLARRMPRWILPGSPGRFTTIRPISLRAGWEVFQETACPSRCCASCGTRRSRRCARARRPRRPVRPSLNPRRQRNQPTPGRQNPRNEGENGRGRDSRLCYSLMRCVLSRQPGGHDDETRGVWFLHYLWCPCWGRWAAIRLERSTQARTAASAKARTPRLVIAWRAKSFGTGTSALIATDCTGRAATGPIWLAWV